MPVFRHSDQVDLTSIIATFSEDRKHRFSLHIPLTSREGSRTLCVIGQNPSDADEKFADKTIQYLERLVSTRLPDYRAIVMLNLYTRVDKHKEHSDVDFGPVNWLDPIRQAARDHSDFLLVYGKPSRQGAYDFPKRASALKEFFASSGEHAVFKLAPEKPTKYPPHPGNPQIRYSNLGVRLTEHAFDDVPNA